MRPITDKMLDGYDISVNGFTTTDFDCSDTDTLSIQIYITGGNSPTGTFIIEGCAQSSTTPSNLLSYVQDVVPRQSITNNSSLLYNLTEIAFNYIRVTYQRTSGTGVVTLYINKKIHETK